MATHRQRAPGGELMAEEIKENPAEQTIPQVDNALQGLPDEYVPDADIPKVLVEPGHLRFTWIEHSIVVHVRHFDNLRCRAEIEIWYYLQETGHNKLVFPPTNVELMSASARQTVAKQLHSQLFGFPWDWMISCVAFKTHDVSRQQEPTEEIMSQTDLDLEPDYLLEPMLYRGHPTVVYGDKGSTKSLLALVIAYIVQLPLAKNGIGFTTDGNHSCRVLYLDYEDEKMSFRKRWTAIQNGFRTQKPVNPNSNDPSDEIPSDLELPIYYRRMTTRLADSVESLRTEIADKHIGLLIVDSLGPAARGNLFEAEGAIEYNQALRVLGLTSLTLAHNSKDPNQTKKSIYGSVFFTNLARSTWECKAETYPDENEVAVSLEETNANLARKHGTLGFKYTFDTKLNRINIETTDLEMTGLSGELPLTLRMKNLARSGARTIAEYAETLEAKEQSVKAIAYRLVKKQLWVKIHNDVTGEDRFGCKLQQ